MPARSPHNRFLTTATTGADGKFQIPSLPPGAYLAVAMPSLVDGEWAELEELARLVARATRFTLADGESNLIAIRLVTR